MTVQFIVTESCIQYNVVLWNWTAMNSIPTLIVFVLFEPISLPAFGIGRILFYSYLYFMNMLGCDYSFSTMIQFTATYIIIINHREFLRCICTNLKHFIICGGKSCCFYLAKKEYIDLLLEKVRAAIYMVPFHSPQELHVILKLILRALKHCQQQAIFFKT